MKKFFVFFLISCLLLPFVSAGLFDFLVEQKVFMIPFYPKDAEFDSIEVDGDANFFSNVGIEGDLYVDGNITFHGDINVVGDFDVNGVILGNDSNFVNIGVSEGTYVNRLVATGDSNFANIGISENAFLNTIIGTGNINIINPSDYNFYWNNTLGSLSIGYNTIASDEVSLSFGYDTIASGWASTAIGYLTEATGDQAFAAGAQNHATGDNSVALNVNARASGDASMAIGSDYTDPSSGAFGERSFSSGYGTTASGEESSSFGHNTQAVGRSSIAGGYSTSINPPRIFAIGIGSLAFGYSDANHVAEGKGSVALGYNCIAKEEASICLGKDLTNYNANSVLVNDLNIAGNLNIDGDFNITGNIAVEGISFTNGGIIATGDSNFTNLEADAYYSTGNITGNDLDINAGTGYFSTTGTGRFDGGLYDDDGHIVIDLADQYLKRTNGINAISWGTNGYLYAGSGSVSYDFGSNLMYGDDTYTSLDAGSRTLKAIGGSDIILDWSTTGTADFGDSNIVTTGDSNFTNIGVSKNYYSDGNITTDTINISSTTHDALNIAGAEDHAAYATFINTKGGIAFQKQIDNEVTYLNTIWNAAGSTLLASIYTGWVSDKQLNIRNNVSDGDIVFRFTDGGVAKRITLDGSANTLVFTDDSDLSMGAGNLTTTGDINTTCSLNSDIWSGLNSSTGYTYLKGYTSAGGLEDLRLQWNDSYVTITSTTGISLVEWLTSFKLSDNKTTTLGTSNDSSLSWQTADITNNYLAVATQAGSAAQSGWVSVIEVTSLGTDVRRGYRDPPTTPVDPVFAVWSGDLAAGGANDYLAFTHNRTDSVIFTGAGDLLINPATGFVGINTASPTVALDITGDLTATGDINAHNGNFDGNILGETPHAEGWYYNQAGMSINLPTDEWIKLDLSENTHLNGFHIIDGNFGVELTGEYRIVYNASGSGANNHSYITSVLVNDINQANTFSFTKLEATGTKVTMGGQGFLNLSEGDIIALAVKDFGGTSTGTVYHYSFTISYIGS